MRTRGIAIVGILGLLACTGGSSDRPLRPGEEAFALVDTDWSEPNHAGGSPCGGSNERTCPARYICNAGRCATRCGDASFDGSSRNVALVCGEHTEVTGTLDNADAFRTLWIPLEGGAMCGGHLTIETASPVHISAVVACSGGAAVDVDCGTPDGSCEWSTRQPVDLRWTCKDSARAAVLLTIRSADETCGASPIEFSLQLAH